MTQKRMPLQTPHPPPGPKLWILEKGPKITKKECRRTPTAASWGETLDSEKGAENDTKKNVAAHPQLRAGPKLWITLPLRGTAGGSGWSDYGFGFGSSVDL